MICDIAQLGADVLRQIAVKVDNVDSIDVKQLIDDMICTLATTQGVGIAAPQIGFSKQIIIIASRPTPRYPNAPLMEPTVMINPLFEKLSEIQESDWEGCLSIPGIRALVPRYKNILIEYTSDQGSHVKQELDGFVARVFQHEHDHLVGRVYLDKVESNKDIFSETEYFKLLERSTAN